MSRLPTNYANSDPSDRYVQFLIQDADRLGSLTSAKFSPEDVILAILNGDTKHPPREKTNS